MASLKFLNAKLINRMKKLILRISEYKLIFISVVFLVFFSVGCVKKDEKEIKIGAVFCLTGSGKTVGEDALKGVVLAVEQINNKGGIFGKKVKLIVEDDQTSPQLSVSATQKLVNFDKVKVIIGALPSSNTLADIPIAESAKIILFSPASSNPKISDGGDYIFRNWISDLVEGSAMAHYTYNVLKQKKLAILFVNNEYGGGLKDVFKNTFEQLGGKVTITESYEQDATDFRTQLTKIKATSPDSIYSPGHPKEMALILNQAKEMKIVLPFESAVAFEDPVVLELAKGNAEGVIYSTPFFDISSDNPTIKNFIETFRNKYKRDPGVFAAHGYDALNIIALAIQKGGYDSDKIKEQLYKVKDFDGVSGKTSFDQNGDVIKAVSIKTVKKGKFIPLVNNYDFSTGNDNVR